MLTRPAVFTGFLQSGQIIIPPGTRCFQINVVSGSANIGGFLYYAGAQVSLSLPDSKDLLGYPIVIGMSGLGNATNVFYVQ